MCAAGEGSQPGRVWAAARAVVGYRLDSDSDRCLENCEGRSTAATTSQTAPRAERERERERERESRGGICSCHSQGLPPLSHPACLKREGERGREGAWRTSPADHYIDKQVGYITDLSFFIFYLP